MMRSMYSAVSGLRNHQTRMDVIANNIANVNTTAFKAERATFKDIYYDTIRPASGSIGNQDRGGMNASQVGLGMTVNTIDTMFLQGAPEITSRTLDLALSGDGFFVVQYGDEVFYTRAGNFYLDENGDLVNSDGGYVMGYDENYTPGTLESTPPTFIINLKHPSYPDEQYTYITIDSTGKITALDSASADGAPVILGYIGVASFFNQEGLEKIGNNLFKQSNNSGEAAYATAGVKGMPIINPSALEMSNVNLAQEFTNMIVTQRGFQANARTITVSDSMLEELVNLKR